MIRTFLFGIAMHLLGVFSRSVREDLLMGYEFEGADEHRKADIRMRIHQKHGVVLP